MAEQIVIAYAGFSDGKPHSYDCDIDGEGCVAIYRRRKDAIKKYQDVRRVMIVYDDPDESREDEER